jgi:sterol desaturase/sphingolipid hydroxylase (fatty acid hydroxylase superfamily)
LSEQEFQLFRFAGFIAALAVALTLQHLRPQSRSMGAWRVNAALWLTNGAVMGVVCGACACSVALWARAAGVGILNLLHAPLAVATVVTVVALDAVSYGWHRANHRLAVLWRFHRVHHSDTTFTVSTGLRFHPGELLLSLPLRLTAVMVIGAPPAAIIIFEVTFAIANLIEHGNIALPRRMEERLGRLFITPAAHRWHHSRDRVALNTNFGTIFSFWDRLFATYARNTSEVRVDAGLPDLSGRIRWLEALALPWRGAGGPAPTPSV